jgi:hypothetical protein
VKTFLPILVTLTYNLSVANAALHKVSIQCATPAAPIIVGDLDIPDFSECKDISTAHAKRFPGAFKLLSCPPITLNFSNNNYVSGPNGLYTPIPVGGPGFFGYYDSLIRSHQDSPILTATLHNQAKTDLELHVMVSDDGLHLIPQDFSSPTFSGDSKCVISEQ